MPTPMPLHDLDALGAKLVVRKPSLARAVQEVDDPESEHAASKAALKAYEEGYEETHGHKPRSRHEWGEMWHEFERYAALRQVVGKAARERAAGMRV